MDAILNAEDFKGFEERVKILKDKGVELDYTVKVLENGKEFKVILNQDYDPAELDKLTEG